jgi:hypothetical protein
VILPVRFGASDGVIFEHCFIDAQLRLHGVVTHCLKPLFGRIERIY